MAPLPVGVAVASGGPVVETIFVVVEVGAGLTVMPPICMPVMGGRGSFVWGLKTSPPQGMLQAASSGVVDWPTYAPHQHSAPALTPAYWKLSAKQAASHVGTVSWLLLPPSPAVVVRLLSVSSSM